MEESQSPYAAPQSNLTIVQDKGSLNRAGKGRRFINYLIDVWIVQLVLSFIIGFAGVLLIGDAWINFVQSVPELVFSVSLIVIYYLIFEGGFGFTLGKLITGTRAVNDQGLPPSFGQTLGRTFARLIPFEAFSFLGKTSRGLHDSLSNTYVICIRESNKAKVEVNAHEAKVPETEIPVAEASGTRIEPTLGELTEIENCRVSEKNDTLRSSS